MAQERAVFYLLFQKRGLLLCKKVVANIIKVVQSVVVKNYMIKDAVLVVNGNHIKRIALPAKNVAAAVVATVNNPKLFVLMVGLLCQLTINAGISCSMQKYKQDSPASAKARTARASTLIVVQGIKNHEIIDPEDIAACARTRSASIVLDTAVANGSIDVVQKLMENGVSFFGSGHGTGHGKGPGTKTEKRKKLCRFGSASGR